MAGLAAGHLLGGPDWGSRGALAIAIAHANNAAPQATLAAVLFLLDGVVVAAIYQAWHRRRKPAPADTVAQPQQAHP